MMGGEGEKSELDEKLEYLEKVKRELAERESRLSAAEAEIAEIEFKLKEGNFGRTMLQGNTNKILSLQSYQSRLRKDLERKLKHRSLIVDEVQRAKERRQQVEAELDGNEESGLEG